MYYYCMDFIGLHGPVFVTYTSMVDVLASHKDKHTIYLRNWTVNTMHSIFYSNDTYTSIVRIFVNSMLMYFAQWTDKNC